jgi:hypothetical protein
MNPSKFIQILRKHSISKTPPNYSAYDLNVSEILDQWYYNPITNYIHNKYNNHMIAQSCKLFKKYIKKCPKWIILQDLSSEPCYICNQYITTKDLRIHCLEKHTQKYCLNYTLPSINLQIKDIINNSVFIKVIKQLTDNPDIADVIKHLNV